LGGYYYRLCNRGNFSIAGPGSGYGVPDAFTSVVGGMLNDGVWGIRWCEAQKFLTVVKRGSREATTFSRGVEDYAVF